MSRLEEIEAAIKERDLDGMTADQAWLTEQTSWLLDRVRELDGALNDCRQFIRGRQDVVRGRNAETMRHVMQKFIDTADRALSRLQGGE